jgi:aryl-alcohol dehydrogenase-like predicted oxidoreductase
MNSVPTMVRAWVVRRDFRVMPTIGALLLLQLRDNLTIRQMPVTIVGTLFIRVRG